MKTILIATDFTPAARNAAIYGLHFAKAIHARVILYNAYHVSSSANGLNVTVSRYDIQKQMEKKLEDEAESIRYVNLPQVKIICEEGDAENSILKIAEEKNADFIIVGMKKCLPGFRKIFGSTVTQLAKNPAFPLMIIPEHAKFSIPGKILYATDLDDVNNLQPVSHLQFVSQLFTSSIAIVKVLHENEVDKFESGEISPELRDTLKVIDANVQYPVDDDIRHALHELIIKANFNMLVMVPHQHSWIERLFTKSMIKEMIFHTAIPLLILPEFFPNLPLLEEKDVQDGLHIYPVLY